MTDRPPDAETSTRRFVDGGSFILDAPAHVPAVWGDEASGEVLWAAGEAMILAAPDGAGKGTVMQQLALRRAGVVEDSLLGYPIAVGSQRVLYIAADRPAQIARSWHRMVTEDVREALDLGIVVWRGPLPFDLGREPERFVPFVRENEVDTVIIDSLGLIASDLASDEAGSRVARGMSDLVAEGIELAALYHPRKREAGTSRVRTLEDLYGSRWISAASGSVVYLDGQPGDLVVHLRHLKQPAAEVGPLTIRHDHDAGRTEIHGRLDLLDLAADGITVKGAAKALFEVSEPSTNEIEKARRRLNKLADRGDLDSPINNPGEPTVYRRPS